MSSKSASYLVKNPNKHIKKMYQCNQCDKAFAQNSKLKIHTSTHTGLKPYQCIHCNKAFSYNKSLLKHMQMHSEDKQYHCRKCDKSFADRSNLTLHFCEKVITNTEMLSVTNIEETTVQCSQCNKVFANKKQLSNHQRTHSGIKPYKCSQCDKVFSYPGSLQFHMKSHTHFQCSQCSKTFSQYKDFKMHMRTHTGVKQYKCSRCDKGFSYPRSLKVHMKSHTKETPFHCSLCDSKFSQSNELKDHLNAHPEENLFQCSQCSKTFSHNKDLLRHIRIHSLVKPHQCSQCDKAYTEYNNLKIHMRKHTGEKPYQCKHCGKSFSQNCNLKTHLRKHTGEKPYQCKICNKAFTLKSTLTCHIRTHTGEKPFQCSQCDKAFAQRIGLKLHMRTHTGEKPHQCSLCDKTFLQKQNLTTHYRTHHHAMTQPVDTQYQCNHCDKAFFQINIYVSHLRTHTGKKNTVKGFTEKQSVVNHCRIPTTEKPYQSYQYEKVKSKKVKSSCDANGEENYVEKFNIPSKELNMSKKCKIPSSDETIDTNMTVNKSFESFSCKSDEEILLKKPTNCTKKTIKKKSTIKSDTESKQKKHQLFVTKQKKLKSGKENEENIKVKKSKNLTKKVMTRKSAAYKRNCDVPETVGTKKNQSKSKMNASKQFSEKVKDGRSQKSNSKETTDIEVINLSDDEDETIQKSVTMDDVLWAIDKVFDLFEESTEGVWTRTPNHIEQDLYDVLQSLKLDRFENNSYPKIYNLDVNYRQLYILLSGVDGMILEHALLCTKSYTHCEDIPEKHKEDMSCCNSKSGELSLERSSFASLGDESSKLETSKFTTSKYVSCRYDSRWWIGMIQNIDVDTDDFEIKFLHPHGPSKSFYWPPRDDICYLPLTNILCLISTPSTINGRTYQILNDDTVRTELAFKSSKAI